jgi:hypothetical protein
MTPFYRLFRAAKQLLACSCLLVLFAGAAAAYTVVLRNGRRIEIPAQFTVTGSTITYELAPGFQKTLMLASIDIAATEQANGEQPGSLLGRQGLLATRERLVESTNRSPATRSITNRDLEPYARERLQSEESFNRRQRERGLPSLQEIRARNRLADERMLAQWEERRREEAENERARTHDAQLENKLSAMAAELSAMRTQLNESNPFATNGGIVGDVLPYGYGYGGQYPYGGYGGQYPYGGYGGQYPYGGYGQYPYGGYGQYPYGGGGYDPVFGMGYPRNPRLDGFGGIQRDPRFRDRIFVAPGGSLNRGSFRGWRSYGNRYHGGPPVFGTRRR